MTETTEFVYKRTPRGLVLDPITVQVQPPTKIIHEVDEVKFLNQNPDSIGPPIETPRSYVGLEASTQMPLGNTYTLQLPIAQGNAGEVLENDGAGQLEWQPAGIGDVIYTGPTPVPTTRQFAVYDGTDGKKILDSGVTAPPAGSGVGGDILTLTGPTDSVWSPPVSSGTVTSVASTLTVVDGVSLTATPNPITGAGSISLGGSVSIDNTNWKPGGAELAIANGGSGENTPQLAIDALTSVAGANPGEVLTESGGSALWVAGGSGDVTSSTDPSVNNTAVVYDSTTGKIIKEGGVITISGDEIATTSVGTPSTITLSSGIAVFPSFVYGGMRLNYFPTISGPGAFDYVTIVNTGADKGLLSVKTIEEPGYGEYYFKSNASFTINTGAGNFVKIVGTRIASPFPSRFTVDTATPDIEYIGTSSVIVKATMSITWESGGFGSDEIDAQVQIFKNGVGLDNLFGAGFLDDVSTPAYPRNCTLSGLISMNTNDKIDCRVANITNGNINIIVQNFNLNLVTV